jgi:hypothetical protein
MAGIRRTLWAAIVAICVGPLAACRTSRALAEPGHPNTPCTTVESCVRSALLAIRDDLASVEPRALGALAEVEPVMEGKTAGLHGEYGRVTMNGKTRPATFEPANAWELHVTVRMDVRPFEAPSEVRYATTRSGRMLAVQHAFASADVGLRERVRNVVEARVRQLLEAVRDLE